MTIEERKLKPYIVLGPIMEAGEWNDMACAHEPPEKYRPFVEVMAPNARVARKLALADPQFDDIGETSDTVPWKYVRVIQHPHSGTILEGCTCAYSDDDSVDECASCTAWEARIEQVERRIDELAGRRIAA